VGLRSASVRALKSFGIAPNGRDCMEIFWRDKLRRGHSRVLKLVVTLLDEFSRANIISLIIAVGLFLALFFTQLYPEISSLANAQPATGTLVGFAWIPMFGQCGILFASFLNLLQMDFVFKVFLW
jgi:hypothetical protein